MSCDAPLTARPAWSLATSEASTLLRPWAVLARDEAGTLVGAVVMQDQIQDPRAVLTTLAGTDGGHRGAILTNDATVALALGDAVRSALDAQPSPATVILGPLPDGSAVVHAFASGLSGSTEDAAAPIPVIRRDAGTTPDDFLASGMRRSLRKAANRLEADDRTVRTRFTTDASEIVALRAAPRAGAPPAGSHARPDQRSRRRSAAPRVAPSDPEPDRRRPARACGSGDRRGSCRLHAWRRGRRRLSACSRAASSPAGHAIRRVASWSWRWSNGSSPTRL